MISDIATFDPDVMGPNLSLGAGDNHPGGQITASGLFVLMLSAGAS